MIETKTVSPDTNQTQQSPKSCTTTTRATRTYLTVSTLIDASDTLMTVTVALPSRTWRNLWGNVEDTVTIADETYRVDHWEVCDLQLFDVADVRIDLTSDSAMVLCRGVDGALTRDAFFGRLREIDLSRRLREIEKERKALDCLEKRLLKISKVSLLFD